MKTLIYVAGPNGRIYAYLLHEATADKREINFPKLSLATSSILGTLDKLQARVIFSFQTKLPIHTKS